MISSKLFRKTLIAVLGIFIVIVGASSFFSMKVMRQQMIEEYLNKAQSIVSSISMSVPDVFLEKNAATIQSIIDQYMLVEGVGYVLVHDQENNIIAHTFSPQIPPEIEFHKVHGYFEHHLDHQWIMIDGETYLDVYGAVLMGKGGFIHIGMKMAQINQKIASTLLKIQAFNLGIFILCILAVYQFIKRISQPLVQLTGYAHRLRNRDLDFEIRIKSKDEVGELAATMEGMRQELSGYVHKLQQSVKDATDELQQALTYLGSIMDNMADGLVVLDEEGRIIRYNLSFKRIFSIDKSNLIEEKASRYIGRDLVKFYHTKSTRDHQRTEFSFSGPDNQNIFIEASISLVTMTCGVSYIVIFHDITTRKSMEEELKALYAGLEIKIRERTQELVQTNEKLSNEVNLRKIAEIELQAEKEFFAVTLKSIGDAVLTTDNTGRLAFMNRVAGDILEQDPEECKGRPAQDVFTISDQMGNPIDPFQKVIVTRKIYERSRGAILTGKKGQAYRISLKVSPIYDRQSQILGTVMVFQDISHILHLEEERLRKEKLESIGLLAGGIAHDFNNILTAILNHIIMAKSSMIPDDKNMLKMEAAQKACIRAKRLTQQLLTFSRGGAPIKETTSLVELIEDTIAFTLRGSNVVSTLKLSRNLWPANVDPGQISQVLENLVINAVQAMPIGGTILIRAENMTAGSDHHTPLTPGKYVKIRIKDNGKGISQDNLKKIFDPYFTTKQSGTGLGLATTYSIIKNHNGHIEVYSETGKGTEFTIYLPATSKTVVTKSDSPEETLASGKGKVLVLDDDLEILEVVKEVLDLLGYEPHLVSDGKEVLEKYQKARQKGDPYDLIIMDLTIPGGMGGLETIKRLKAIDPQAKAVVSSGYSQDPVMANYKEYGFSGVLAKPYTIDELGVLLKKILVDNS
ncbi:hybrid sensor histidine kinase/response regulator [Desulfonatronovibrio hydrogenovorans]|uniref:hybrid sensor histidine kinase/response regulator n=1 Tax=Desulfonatronovibrio hydrogenovorans TaxID=53245 RepID=UPI00068B3293|nr:ATP-binding protein [Desulfonatronovibrio hydrogenovorans]